VREMYKKKKKKNLTQTPANFPFPHHVLEVMFVLKIHPVNLPLGVLRPPNPLHNL